MKYAGSFIISMLLCFSVSLSAQQWIDKDYSYNVVTNEHYGTSVNFNGGLDSLDMDIYLPICDETTENAKRPLLMWIHGGAFLDGSKDDPSITDLCIQFAKRGYVTASINYRKGFVADDQEWNCNYPLYSCVFAHDAAEWDRAYYRAVQDAKGAVRFLVNHHEEYQIDTENVFVAGESAGAFLALGTALLDSETERPEATGELPDAPLPHPSTDSCIYNQGHTFEGDGIPRPDLGGFEGTIEPTEIDYTIKAVGNMYGGMLSDLLAYHNPEKPKPGIYNFHQPCDLVVPIDSGNVYAGLSWCFTNGFGCYGISNTTTFYGSRTMKNWNDDNSYGYPMQSEFAGPEFPYNYWFGDGSCVDQVVNDGCHAYDSKQLREDQLALFFADFITTNPVCLPADVTGVLEQSALKSIEVFPNPTSGQVRISTDQSLNFNIEVYNALGQSTGVEATSQNGIADLNLAHLNRGVYFVRLSMTDHPHLTKTLKILRE